MKQTAVEWLIQNIVEDQTIKSKSMSEWIKIFDNAKAMEKEQIKDAYEQGESDGYKQFIINIDKRYESFEQYYNEKFNKKDK